VLQHIACEPPGAFESELAAWKAELTRVEIDETGQVPDWRAFDAIVAMGGPMGAYEDQRLPWLRAEKAMIGEAVRSGVPFWGVCLGAQLLAASLGAEVRPGPQPEVGVLAVQRSPAAAEDPVFSQLPEEFRALQWHADTFELPAGARLMAQSDLYQQAFVVERAYALQFHLEVDAGLAAQWDEVPVYAASLRSMLGDGALGRLIEEVRHHEAQMTSLARRLFAAWLGSVVGAERV
jgi:GMP synthase-like glutamine amidotransferase